MTAAIEIEHMEKTYAGKIRALRGVSMRVEEGEIFGLLGPNGAGKSTLVKVLMTVIRASRCRGTILGVPIGSKGALTRVGYLPEHHRFPGYLKGREVVDFYGAMAGVPRRERRRRGSELLEMVGMSRWANTPVRKYSKGMRQRVGLAQALVNDPRLVLLDEPTDGVDPAGRREIRELCLRMKHDGRAVLINSHLLSELEMVCDRVAILVQGAVWRQGTLDDLTRGRKRYEIELASGWPSGLGAPSGLATGEAVRVEGGVIRADTESAERVAPLVGELVRAGAVIRRMGPIRPSLEDLFMEAVGHGAGGPASGAGSSGAGSGGGGVDP